MSNKNQGNKQNQGNKPPAATSHIPVTPSITPLPDEEGGEEVEKETELTAKAAAVIGSDNKESETAVVVNKTGEKQVNVRCLQDHACSIGAEDLNLKKGGTYKISTSACTILSNAGVVFKI